MLPARNGVMQQTCFRNAKNHSALDQDEYSRTHAFICCLDLPLDLKSETNWMLICMPGLLAGSRTEKTNMKTWMSGSDDQESAGICLVETDTDMILPLLGSTSGSCKNKPKS
jgi:hypothetical protein